MPDEVPVKKVWIAIPVFNRREITLGCLAHLQSLGVLNWCEVVVADGGSTDGTREAVRAAFPGVHLIEGRWWWMEGIRAAMEFARARGAGVYVWLNDDCRPGPGSLEKLVDHAEKTGRVSGGVTKSGGGAYAGMRRTPWGLRSLDLRNLGANDVMRADSLVGNFVAFPASCIERAGLPNAQRFPHLCADHYYTITASLGTGGCDLVGAAVAEDVHPGMGWERQSILRGTQPVSYIFRQLIQWDPRRGILPELRFHRDFWGWRGWLIALGPWLKKWVLLGCRVLVPGPIRRKLR
jgi:hypothetical protein